MRGQSPHAPPHQGACWHAAAAPTEAPPGASSVSQSAKTPGNQTFESALAELEKIVSGMEAGQMPLEKSLAAYKRGAELLKFCQAALQDAQQQVKILEGGVLQDFRNDDRDDER